MSETPLSVTPIISYPREAQVGKTYLMKVDLQFSGEWNYEEEEYPIYCMLETAPLFSSQPVGEPAIILHRFGGSYGEAKFLLTAAQQEREGNIKVTLVNGWGVPVSVLVLEDLKISFDAELKELDNPLTTPITYRENVFNKVQEVKNNRLTKLDLNQSQIASIPTEVFELEWLEELNLSNNRLTFIPSAISHLSNLQKLFLDHNELRQVTPDIAQLANLQELDLSNNRLSQLPPEFAHLSHLLRLDLSRNQLNQLFREITQLINLQTLDLSYNQLSQMPAELAQLTNLQILDLSGNQLRELPSEIAQLLNLHELDISRNQISRLPIEIAQMTSLQTLYVFDNPLEDPPLEVTEQGIEAIREYLRQKLEAEQETIYEAKLIIVGEGAAGKTTLVKKIENPDYPCPTPEYATRGIDVKEWHFILENGEDFRVNILDFGGQEIYHSTHQFFLTKRSLYVLVIDSRKEQYHLDYWLRLVELLSNNSPLLIVKNEKDDRSIDINEVELRGRFENLKAIISTNFSTNRGLDEVVKNIQDYITCLPHIGIKLPKQWKRVREVLETDELNYISLDEYLRICDEHGFKRREDALQLSQFLHDIGVILHFQDDIKSLLYKTVILKPEWATNAVYKIFDHITVRENQGRFTDADLSNIWDDKQYENVQRELLELMMKFQLCYQLPGANDTYIAPQLLNSNQPIYDWNESHNLILRYEYEFMPKGILIRFIVEMHRYIDEPKLWRSGVVLKREDTLAEIIEAYNKQEIKIRLAGSKKREFLAIITDKLDEIHKSYHRLRVSKLIPCNCPVCKNNQAPYFYNLDQLRKRIQYNRLTIECGNPPFNTVNVRSLVDDILRCRIFISYSHRDEAYLKKLQFYLKPLEKQGLVDRWDDTRISPGMRWREEIQKALDHAQIAILLVSSDFLASDFIDEIELPHLLKKAENDGAKIFSIILNPCQSILQFSELNEFQAVNPPSQPLDSMTENEQKAIFNRLIKEISDRLKL